jgi:hypothetical protein
MPVRRIKIEDPIAGLGRTGSIFVTLKGGVVDPAEAAEEDTAIREIAHQFFHRDAIGPPWLDEQERRQKEILRSMPDLPDLAGSPPWYAVRIITSVASLRQMAKAFPCDGWNPLDEPPADVRKNLWLVIEAAMGLASILTEARINSAVGKPLKSGLKQTEHLQKNISSANRRRQAKASAVHRKWRKAATEIWDRKPSLSTVACANSVIQRLSASVKNKTVADRIRDLKPT